MLEKQAKCDAAWKKVEDATVDLIQIIISCIREAKERQQAEKAEQN